jgi:hypothetical protein
MTDPRAVDPRGVAIVRVRVRGAQGVQQIEPRRRPFWGSGGSCVLPRFRVRCRRRGRLRRGRLRRPGDSSFRCDRHGGARVHGRGPTMARGWQALGKNAHRYLRRHADRCAAPDRESRNRRNQRGATLPADGGTAGVPAFELGGRGGGVPRGVGSLLPYCYTLRYADLGRHVSRCSCRLRDSRIGSP